jgi:hypothetical protein
MRLVKKPVYVRCADAGCSQVYLYMSKTGASLNYAQPSGCGLVVGRQP